MYCLCSRSGEKFREIFKEYAEDIENEEYSGYNENRFQGLYLPKFKEEIYGQRAGIYHETQGRLLF